MIRKRDIVKNFIYSQNFKSVFYLPCSTFKDLIKELVIDEKLQLIPINREDEGIGLITGTFLAGEKSLLLIQDSGLGNSYNSIVSLLNLYQIPVMIIASMRGFYNEISAPNALWSDNTSKIHDSIGIKEFVLDDRIELKLWRKQLYSSANYLKILNKPVIVKIDFVEEASNEL